MNFDRDNPDYTGTFLGRKYNVLSHLGTGGFGAVFRAEQKDDRGRTIRDVALKIFTCDPNDRAAISKRFDDFSKDMSPLVHLEDEKAVVAFYTHERYDVLVSSNGEVYTTTPSGSADTILVERLAFVLVLEYADGGHVGARYRNDKIVNAQDATYLDHLIDICCALRAAHNAGIIHRDIKLSNLLYSRRLDQMKLADFGIATYLGDLQSLAGGLAGTPPYMAPELFGGGCGDAKSDIYALGHALYELFTGERAFVVQIERNDPQRNMASILAAYEALHSEAPRPDAVVKVPELISVNLSATISLMMDPNPKRRPDLDTVIEALKKERELRFPTDPRGVVRPEGRPSDLPSRSVYLSDFCVNPQFRQNALNETLFLIAVNLENRTRKTMADYFSLLDRFFPRTYSTYQVFGPHDFLIRVWADPTRPFVQGFCESMIQYVLDGKRSKLQVMACDEVNYLAGDSARGSINGDITIAKVHLNNSQSDETEIRAPAYRWLKNHGIFVCPRPCQDGLIKCFCLVASPDQSHDSLCGQYLRLIDAIRRSYQHCRRDCVSVYKKRFSPVTGLTVDSRLENMSPQFVVEYTVSRYKDAVSIPSVISDHLGDLGLRTATLLATGQLVVDSDRVAPQ